MGLRSHRGSLGQPRPSRIGSDGRQHSAAAWLGAGAQTEPKHELGKKFIRSHMAVLAGIDFFTVEVLTWRGLVTYYVLFFIHLESRRVSLAGYHEASG